MDNDIPSMVYDDVDKLSIQTEFVLGIYRKCYNASKKATFKKGKYLVNDDEFATMFMKEYNAAECEYKPSNIIVKEIHGMPVIVYINAIDTLTIIDDYWLEDDSTNKDTEK